MFQTILSRIGWFLLLLLLQVLVFNHIHIMGYATPMPYVYFLLILPSNTPRWLYILLGFLLGVLIDIFGNTPGMAAATMTAIGLITPLLFNLFGPRDRDKDDNILPSMRTMERWPFVRYLLTAVFLQCLIFFSIESFSFFNWTFLLINIAGSTVLTTLFCIALELIRKRP